MTHPLVKLVEGMVYEGNIDSAERALATVADQEGDTALARVIEQLPPRDVVAILREHDPSRPSLISELITPTQFAAAVALESNYRDRTHEALRGMINGVVFREDADPDPFIEALGASEAGVKALADYFSHRHAELEFFFRNGTYSELDGADFSELPEDNEDLTLGDPDSFVRRDIIRLTEAEDGDWKELGWRLRCEHYEIFREVLEILRLAHRRALAEAERALAPTPIAAAPADEDDEDDVL